MLVFYFIIFLMIFFFFFFFFFLFQAEDGIRDTSVTGVQTCALPIWDRCGFPTTPADAPDKVVALLEVFGVARVIGICGPLDFDMAFDGGAGHPVKGEHAALTLVPADPNTEHPGVSCRGEVSVLLPGLGLIGVSSGSPTPQFTGDIMVQLGRSEEHTS